MDTNLVGERWPGERSSKSDSIPVTQTDFGYQQRSSWRQVDRLDEEVIELDGPYSLTVTSDTEVFTFVLLGDQNAGKSTFLHSFSHQVDASFLEMTSLLPVLSASFVNSRFLSETDQQAPMDELPFIDTDLARATISLTIDDFAFWITERELDHSLVTDLPSDTCYVVIQFIEFGGDHLDQLMKPELATTQITRDIVERSRSMLMNCRKIVYFLNGATLLPALIQPIQPGATDVQCAPVETLCSRLEFLSRLFSAGADVMFAVARCKNIRISVDDARNAFATVSSVTGKDLIPIESDQLSAGQKDFSVDQLLTDLLARLTEANRYTLRMQQQVLCVEHLNSDGTLAPEAINRTLAHMFHRGMIRSKGAPGYIAAEHLLKCFKIPLLRVDEDTKTFSPFVSRDTFQEYIDSLDGHAEVPDTSLVYHYEEAIRCLADAGIIIVHYASNLSNISVELNVDSSEEPRAFRVAPPTVVRKQEAASSIPVVQRGQTVCVSGAGSNTTFRFPYWHAFFDVIDCYFQRGVPLESWLHNGWLLNDHQNENLRKRVFDAMDAMETHLWKSLSELVGNSTAIPNGSAVLRWMWLLEDLYVANQLLRPNTNMAKATFAIPSKDIERQLEVLMGTVLEPTSVASAKSATIRIKFQRME